MDIKQNLQVLKDFLSKLPEAQIDLDSYGCGTHFCAAGWLPHIPHFQDLGVKADFSSAPVIKLKSAILPDNWMTPVQTLAELFGEYAYHRLFAAYNCGAHDSEFGKDLSDKQLALARIDKALEAFQ